MSNTLNDFIQQLAKRKIESNQDFLSWKRRLTANLKIAPPSNVEILNTYKKLRKGGKIKLNLFFDQKLKKRPIRSSSGVTVVSVLTKPWPCPGHCLYCPTEKGIPKSYLSGEPAVERAKFLKYDPYNQVRKRIEALEKTGHPTDKIELIVIGGTWSFLPKKYQNWFIKRCFEGANFQESKIMKRELRDRTLEVAQRMNETAKHRIVGLTLETRPDYITPQEILRMRELGCTRVEIGVQTIDDQILNRNKRGHNVKKIIQATKLLKDAGFKVCYHLMPGLPGSTPQKDLAVFKKIFSNSDFRPDMVKIYPCVVTRGSILYKLWQQKKYRPYSDRQLVKLLTNIKSIIPPYVRVIRIVRDIPSFKIEGGSKISNLREVLQKEMAKHHLKCRCIRCREIKNKTIEIKNLKLKKIEYPASAGQEIFLSFENTRLDKLVALLRFRLPENHSLIRANSRIDKQRLNNEIDKYLPVLKEAAIIREVHTYGELVPLGERRQATQHLGLGKKLVEEAENIAKQRGYSKIAVIAGIGVREYYRQLGYKLKNTYLIKNL